MRPESCLDLFVESGLTTGLQRFVSGSGLHAFRCCLGGRLGVRLGGDLEGHQTGRSNKPAGNSCAQWTSRPVFDPEKRVAPARAPGVKSSQKGGMRWGPRGCVCYEEKRGSDAGREPVGYELEFEGWWCTSSLQGHALQRQPQGGAA